jgi:hypothetical protein
MQPAVLYVGLCESMCVALRKEHRPSAFENRVLKRIFGKREEVSKGLRKRQNKDIHNFYSLPDIRLSNQEG